MWKKEYCTGIMISGLVILGMVLGIVIERNSDSAVDFIKSKLPTNEIIIRDTTYIHDTTVIEKSAFDLIKEFKNEILKPDTIK